jgi:hypothetical protein
VRLSLELTHVIITYSGRKECFFFDEILEQKDGHRLIVQKNQINEIRLERFGNFATLMFTTTNVKIPLSVMQPLV